MAEKIRILILAANPIDAGFALRVDKEAREIVRRIKSARTGDSFDVITEGVVRTSDLQQALIRYAPQIVHMMGQHRKNRGIMLQDRKGEVAPVSGQVFARLFRIAKDQIRIVFFNGYLSRNQKRGLLQSVDFTIVTNAIADEESVVFASLFYQALAFGKSVTVAFELAKTQLDFEGIDESNTPQLLVREGVNPSTAYLNETTESGISAAFRSIKSPVKEGNISIADAARAVRIVASHRTR